MNQGNTQIKNLRHLRSKRETCLACDQRNQCQRPVKDTEDEETSLSACEKYIVNNSK